MFNAHSPSLVEELELQAVVFLVMAVDFTIQFMGNAWRVGRVRTLAANGWYHTSPHERKFSYLIASHISALWKEGAYI